MKFYISTRWHSYEKWGILSKGKTVIELISIAIVRDRYFSKSYYAASKEISNWSITDPLASAQVSMLPPRNNSCWKNLKQIRTDVVSFIEHSMAGSNEEIQLCGINCQMDQFVFNSLMLHAGNRHPDFIPQVFYDIKNDLLEVANHMDDMLFGILSDFTYQPIKAAVDRNYSLSEKLTMFESHPEYPTGPNNPDASQQAVWISLLESFIKKMDAYADDHI